MKIIIAPDSFKGSSSSINAAQAIKRGIKKIYPSAECIIVPVADGGEGTVEAAVSAAGGKYKTVKVTGPLGKAVKARFGILPGGKAVIEMAEASGITLIPKEQLNPLKTSTYGTGELIKAALDVGCTQIMMGIGGSATTDCGIGMAAALGAKFLNEKGVETEKNGSALLHIKTIDLSNIDPRIKNAEIITACDVTNPLHGNKGAAYIYGPQKGAGEAMVKELDAGLKNMAGLIKKQLKSNAADIPGAGAAGGLGCGLTAFLGSRLMSGIDAVLDIVNFNEIIKDADLIITGEGKIDGQSIYGKVPVGIAGRAAKFGIPVIAIVGDIGENTDIVYNHGIDAVISTVNKAMPLEEAMAESSALLEETAERVMRIIKVGKSLPL